MAHITGRRGDESRGGLATDHPEPVATTWSLSLDLVQQSNPIAVDILRLCAFLHPDIISEEIVMAALVEFFLSDVSDQTSQMRFNEVLSVLLRFSLIRRNAETRTITIHRLVQVMIQDTMEKEIQEQWARKAVQAVQQAFPQPSTIYSAAGHPHSAIQLLSASVYLHRECGDKKELAATLWKLAVQQQVIGHLRDAERNLLESLALCRDVGDWFNEAKAHQYFALLCIYQELFSEALAHLDKALLLLQKYAHKETESAIYAYYALCYLHANETTQASVAAHKARILADETHEKRDIIRAEWLLGWVYTQQHEQDPSKTQHLSEAKMHLGEALQSCRQFGIVDYEADILLAWAHFADKNGDRQQAEKYAEEALALAKKSAFTLLQADICNFLARLEQKRENGSMAKMDIVNLPTIAEIITADSG